MSSFIMMTILFIGFIVAWILIEKMKKSEKQNAKNFKDYLLNQKITEDNLEKIYIVESCFNIKNNIVLVGNITKGTIKVGDTLNYLNKNMEVKTINILKIEVFKAELQEASSGQYVALTIDIKEKVGKLTHLFK